MTYKEWKVVNEKIATLMDAAIGNLQCAQQCTDIEDSVEWVHDAEQRCTQLVTVMRDAIISE